MACSGSLSGGLEVVVKDTRQESIGSRYFKMAKQTQSHEAPNRNAYNTKLQGAYTLALAASSEEPPK